MGLLCKLEKANCHKKVLNEPLWFIFKPFNTAGKHYE
jgi:hypothetical protein